MHVPIPLKKHRPWVRSVLLGLTLALVSPSSPQAATGDLSQQSTPVDKLKVAKDFKVELIYNVPKGEKGSWVAMCTDPKGRLIVSDQYGKLYRVHLPAIGSTESARIEEMDIAVGQAQGLLYAFDSLYVMVANESYKGRGLYRVLDTNGDDKFDEVRLLRKLNGGGEHGPHAILLSPDGKSLTIISGNQTKVTEIDRSRVPLHWSEDHLLTRLWDGNGFMKGVLAPGGWIAKTDPDGKSWELISTGFRNQYDAGYNRDGELFTYDADMEWDMNTPWYRPTRVNLVTSGSEFGWRSGAGKWPAYYPDSLGAVVDIGPGSPTGVVFGYGARFPAKYQEAFFICDWSYGKLYAIHLTPEGSGYRGVAEEFISGSPLPLTDLVVNPRDGALYFAIGGRKTQSGLYRVTYTGRDSTAPSKGVRGGEKERAQRRSLEAFHTGPNPNAVKEAWPFLSHKDRYLRFAARVALEHQDPSTWRERALSERDPQATIQSIIALARVTSKDVHHRKATDPVPDPQLQARMVESLNRIQWSRLSDSLKLDLLRAYSLVFTRLGRPSDTVRQTVIARFDAEFPAKTRELNAELAQMLIYLEAPSAATKVVAMLGKAPSQEEQMDYARALRVLKTGWTPSLRESYFRWFLKAANFRGGASLAGFMRDMKNDAVANLSESEKLALKSVLEARPEKSDPLKNILEGRPFVKEWTVNELAPAAVKGLKGRNFEKGRELFGAVGCFSCHRFATEGAAVGPDLTGVGNRFNSRDLLESIIEPSKEISDQYQPIVVRLKDGSDVTGRIVNLSEETVMVNPNMLDPNNMMGIKRKDIESIQPSRVSMMPEGLVNILKEDEIMDLLAFVLSGGDRKNKMFK